MTVAGGRQTGMADVFVEWAGRAATDHRPIPDIDAADCFDLHRVHWEETFIAEAAPRKICHFRAPDAESVRIAFRQSGVPTDAVWTGTIHDGDASARANIVIERELLPPLPANPLHALELVKTEWLVPCGFKLARAIVSSGHGRVICFCEAPIGAMPQIRIRPESVWSCRRLTADRP